MPAVLTYTRTEQCGPGVAAKFRCPTSYSVLNHHAVFCSGIPPTLVCSKPVTDYTIRIEGFCCREMAVGHPLRGIMPRYYTFHVDLAGDRGGFGPYCDYVGGDILLEYNERGYQSPSNGLYSRAWVSKQVQVGDLWYWWFYTCGDLQGGSGADCAVNNTGEDICLVASAYPEYGSANCVLWYNWMGGVDDGDNDIDTQSVDCWSPIPRRYTFSGSQCPNPEVYMRCMVQQESIYKYPVFPPS